MIDYMDVIHEEYRIDETDRDDIEEKFIGEGTKTVLWEARKGQLPLEFYNIVDKFNGLLYSEINIKEVSYENKKLVWKMDAEGINDVEMDTWGDEVAFQLGEAFERVEGVQMDRVEGFWKVEIKESLG